MQILKELIFIKDWRLTNFSFKSLRTNAQIAVRFRSYSTFHTLKQKPQRTFPILPPVYSLFMCACCVMCAMMLHELKYELGRTEIAARIIIKGETVGKRAAFAAACTEGNNNNYNIYQLQLGCHPVAAVILHVYKIWNWLLINLSREGYIRSM